LQEIWASKIPEKETEGGKVLRFKGVSSATWSAGEKKILKKTGEEMSKNSGTTQLKLGGMRHKTNGLPLTVGGK